MIKSCILILIYLTQGGVYKMDLAKVDSLEECLYIEAVIINDHAYMPNNTLVASGCREQELTIKDLESMM